MQNRGIGGVNAVFVARSIVYDLGSAIGTFGEELLEGLTGLQIAELSRSQGKLERVSILADKIDSKLRALGAENYLLKEGGLSKKAIAAIADETLRDELEILSKIGEGTHAASVAGFDAKGEQPVPFQKGHSYRRISARKTVSTTIRRGRREPIKEDLRSLELTRKGGIDFVFVLDSSGSMKGDKIDACKRAAIGLAAVSVGTLDRVAAVSFRKEPEVICELSDSEDLPLFSEKIVSLTPGGTTSIAKALSIAAGILEDSRSRAAKHILLVTDGLPTEGASPAEEAKEEAEKAAAAGITISVAGIGLEEEGEKLARELAGIGSGNFYNVPAGRAELTSIVLEDRAKSSG